MVELTGGWSEPSLSPLDVCRQCVCFEFKGINHVPILLSCKLTSKIERLYNIEHPRLVREFDEISEMKGNAPQFWISKRWLKGIKIRFILANRLRTQFDRLETL
jgi:ubiquitin carboxyl-terminal hydrolase 48